MSGLSAESTTCATHTRAFLADNSTPLTRANSQSNGNSRQSDSNNSQSNSNLAIINLASITNNTPVNRAGYDDDEDDSDDDDDDDDDDSDDDQEEQSDDGGGGGDGNSGCSNVFVIARAIGRGIAIVMAIYP